MTIKSDKWILEQCRSVGMIYPYCDELVRVLPDGNKVISYGPSSYGYDIRCSNKFKVFKNVQCPVCDPKDFDINNFEEIETDICIIPPNSFVLTSSVEAFIMPRNVTGICLGKSTYARTGVVANITPLEAGWRGILTIELSNTSPNPVKIYADEGIAQVLFFESDEQCRVSYADRGGKYQNQVGITEAKL